MIKLIMWLLMFVFLLVSLSWANSNSSTIPEVEYKQYAASEVSSGHQSRKKQNIQQQDKSPKRKSQQTKSENENQNGKYIIIISLLFISVVSLFLHSNGRLVLYKDYTDAAVTIVSVLCSLVIWLLCKYLFYLSVSTSLNITLLFFCAILLFVIRMTYVTNKNIVFTIMSLLTKYTTTFLFAILFAGLTASNRSPQKEGESISDFELRRKQDDAQDCLWIAAMTALFIWFIHATTKLKEWSSIGSYFSLSFKKVALNSTFHRPNLHDQDLLNIHDNISKSSTMNGQSPFKPGDRVRIKAECKPQLLADFYGHGFVIGMGPKTIDLEYIVAPDADTTGHDVKSLPISDTVKNPMFLKVKLMEKC